MPLRTWSLLLAATLFSHPPAAADTYHRPALPITKIETRQLPDDTVVRQIVGQVSDLLLTAPAFQPDKSYSEIDGARKQEILNELFKIVQYYPGGDQELTRPSLDQDTVEEVLRRFGQIVTIWKDPTTTPHPLYPLSQIAFQTRPYASTVPSLCVSDVATMHFRAIGAINGPYTKVAVSDVEIEHWYHFVGKPLSVEPARATPEQRKSTDLACASLGGFDSQVETFFWARNEIEANRGGWLADAALSQLRAGPVPFVVKCELPNRKTIESCLAEVKLWNAARVSWVPDCKPGETTCSVDVFPMSRLDIVTERSPAHTIKSLDLGEDVVIADAIAD